MRYSNSHGLPGRQAREAGAGDDPLQVAGHVLDGDPAPHASRQRLVQGAEVDRPAAAGQGLRVPVGEREDGTRGPLVRRPRGRRPPSSSHLSWSAVWAEPGEAARARSIMAERVCRMSAFDTRGAPVSKGLDATVMATGGLGENPGIGVISRRSPRPMGATP